MVFGGGMKTNAAFVVLSAMIAVSTAQASAAEVIKAPVGSALVHGESLNPYENSWQMEVAKKDGTTNHDAGVWKDRFEIIDIDGKSYGVRIQDATFKSANGEVAATTRTINIFERRMMAPVTRFYERHLIGKEASSVHIAFKPNAMSLESSADGKTEKTERSVSPAFDFDGGLYALLWSTFP